MALRRSVYILLFPALLFAQTQRTLRIQAVKMVEHNHTRPVSGIQLTVMETGETHVTDHSGIAQFTALETLELVTLKIHPNEWYFQEPESGIIVISQNQQLSTVIIKQAPIAISGSVSCEESDSRICGAVVKLLNFDVSDSTSQYGNFRFLIERERIRTSRFSDLNLVPPKTGNDSLEIVVYKQGFKRKIHRVFNYLPAYQDIQIGDIRLEPTKPSPFLLIIPGLHQMARSEKNIEVGLIFSNIFMGLTLYDSFGRSQNDRLYQGVAITCAIGFQVWNILDYFHWKKGHKKTLIDCNPNDQSLKLLPMRDGLALSLSLNLGKAGSIASKVP